MTKEQITTKIAECENLINITKKARDDALVAQAQSQTKLDASLETLKKYGVTPENAESELAKISKEIDALFAELENSIPTDILKELKRI